MQPSNFVHLHLHTSYSLLDSSLRHDALFKRAVEYKMPAVAMTDHGNMFWLVSRDMLKQMQPGSVVVDVGIDQGGVFETSRPTTHSDPIYEEEGVVHYCVANMPGALARTSTFALTNATFPFAIEIAQNGYKRALMKNSALLLGLNAFHGQVTHPAVADALDMEYVSPEKLLN